MTSLLSYPLPSKIKGVYMCMLVCEVGGGGGGGEKEGEDEGIWLAVSSIFFYPFVLYQECVII
jgi:hypothetical protein